MFMKLTIKVVAFFLGHPVYYYKQNYAKIGTYGKIALFFPFSLKVKIGTVGRYGFDFTNWTVIITSDKKE